MISLLPYLPISGIPARYLPWLAALLCLLLVSCDKSRNAENRQDPEVRTAVQYDENLNPLPDNSSRPQIVTAVKLPGNRIPLQLYTRQLTDRAAEEQIVLTREPPSGNLELFLISPRVVTSVEGSLTDYRIVAQEELQIDLDTFTVQTQDLTNDGVTQEIFVAGKSKADGMQHAYVFQLLLSGPERNVIGLRQIFYQVDSGSYEISFDGKSYYIIHQRVLDQRNYRLELTDLQWNPVASSFVVSKIETIDNSKKLSSRLKSIYNGNEDDFIAEIDGLWLRSNDASGNPIINNSDKVFLFFDAESEELLIYADVIGLYEDDHVIEDFNIVNKIKGLWNRLNLNVQNKYVDNIQNSFYVTLNDSDTIHFFALDGSSYAGTYQRTDMGNLPDYENSNLQAIDQANFQLEGAFVEREQGEKFVFQPDKVTWTKKNGETWQGAYSLFSWYDKSYLEIHLYEVRSNQEMRRTYQVELARDVGSSEREDAEEASIFVVLLYPVKLLDTKEVVRSQENIIRLEREEKIDNRELEDLLPGT